MRHAALATLLIVSALAGCTSVPESGADGCRPGSTDWLFRVSYHGGWPSMPPTLSVKLVTVDGSVIVIQGEWTPNGYTGIQTTENATIQNMNTSQIREALIDAGWYHPDWNYNISYAARTDLSETTFQALCEKITADFPALPSQFGQGTVVDFGSIIYESSTADGVHRTTMYGYPRPDSLDAIMEMLPERGDGFPQISYRVVNDATGA